MNVRGFLRTRSSRQQQGRQITFLVLLLLSFLPYTNTLAGKFVYLDNSQVVENPYAHSFRYLTQIFRTSAWSFEGVQGIIRDYQPMMSFAYLLIYRIAGANAFAFHFTNLILHALTVWLIFCVLQRLSGERVAMVAAGLFALHPIHTESVAWIGGISELELSVFYLLTFLLYLKLSGTSPGIVARAGMCLSFALALLSNEAALTLPILIVIFEHFYREDRSTTTLRQKIARYGPIWTIAVVYLAVRVFLLAGIANVALRTSLSAYDTLLTASSLAGAYLGKLIWPAHLSMYYTFHASTSLNDPGVLAGLAGLALCGVLFVALWRRVRILSFGLVWLFLTLAPVLNPRWAPANAFAEINLYLPSVGFCWIVGWAAVVAWSGEAPLLPRLLSRAVPIALMVVAMLCGIRTVRRNRDWANDETLYRRTLESQPDASAIRSRLGATLFNRGDLPEAEQELQEALSTEPTNAFALSNLGLLRASQHRMDEALNDLDKAVQIDPTNLFAQLSLADVLADGSRASEAESHYRTAIADSPLSVNARNHYAKFLFDAGRVDDARNEYERSLGVDPTADACGHLGDIYTKWQNWKLAEDSYEHAIALDPKESGAHFGLGKLYEADGRPGDALREIERGLVIDPTNADAQAAAIRLRGAAPHLPSVVPH